MTKNEPKITEKGPTLGEKAAKPIVKNGRVTAPDFMATGFSLAPGIKKYLDEQGLEARFINIKLIQNSGGVHPRGWQPVKFPKDVMNSAGAFGQDVDGYMRRGELILAAKKKEDVAHHRAWLKQTASDNSVDNLTRRKYKEMRDMIKDTKLQEVVEVISGYDENA